MPTDAPDWKLRNNTMANSERINFSTIISLVELSFPVLDLDLTVIPLAFEYILENWIQSILVNFLNKVT